MASARKFYIRKPITTVQGHISECWSFFEPPRIEELVDDGANSIFRVTGILRLWKDEAARDTNKGHGDEVHFSIEMTRANPPKQKHVLDAIVTSGTEFQSWNGNVNFTGGIVT